MTYTSLSVFPSIFSQLFLFLSIFNIRIAVSSIYYCIQIMTPKWLIFQNILSKLFRYSHFILFNLGQLFNLQCYSWSGLYVWSNFNLQCKLGQVYQLLNWVEFSMSTHPWYHMTLDVSYWYTTITATLEKYYFILSDFIEGNFLCCIGHFITIHEYMFCLLITS